MIVTTTNAIEGRRVAEYKGIVCGEVITGVNFMKDFMAGLRDIVGGRSEAYEREIVEARAEALREMEAEARRKGADAVLAVDIDYEVLGQTGSMLMVTASGTAVTLE